VLYIKECIQSHNSYEPYVTICHCVLCIRNYIQSLTSGHPKLAANSVIPKAVARNQTEVIHKEEKKEERNSTLLEDVRNHLVFHIQNITAFSYVYFHHRLSILKRILTSQLCTVCVFGRWLWPYHGSGG
jgi:hypothetical protein